MRRRCLDFHESGDFRSTLPSRFGQKREPHVPSITQPHWSHYQKGQYIRRVSASLSVVLLQDGPLCVQTSGIHPLPSLLILCTALHSIAITFRYARDTPFYRVPHCW
ncbi:hypothetical protein M407DRAFT_122448 [Tulasnella calospora MUT 4182]|uniref:Uncharacterized protein n=1 Tax=Tulasnella calospora MUT 4182 TaxID=1051891 RepID=A0A0C3Q1D9_9AGAM|nr:hypothetical protein M407DRAFT_122448 [Tulasnella calospora MUT 4182]